SIYTMEFSDVQCDLIEFDQLKRQELHVNEHNLIKFEKALTLYKGDLLEEKDYLCCIHDRERYYQQYFELAMSVATYYANKNQRKLLGKLYHQVRPILMEEDYNLLKSNGEN